MQIDPKPVTDPSDDQNLSEDIQSLIGLDALHTTLMADIETQTEELGMNDACCRVMIRLEQPYRLGDLARATHMLPSTMTALVDQLEADGLVERIRDPKDRRAWLVSLTTNGAQMRDELTERAHELFRSVTGFDAQETAAFAKLMNKARKNIHDSRLERSR